MTIKIADGDNFQYQAFTVQFADRLIFLKKKCLKNYYQSVIFSDSENDRDNEGTPEYGKSLVKMDWIADMIGRCRI